MVEERGLPSEQIYNADGTGELFTEKFTSRKICSRIQESEWHAISRQEKSAPGFKKAKGILLPLFTLQSHKYSYFRLSGLFTQVPTSQGNRDPTVN